MTDKRLRIQQTLHGYAQGHQQLATSCRLPLRDAKTILTLSDISGPGVRVDESGYLTGYPLSESKQYVVARTWLATEMPRPGCVWTHSLLIDFADLAVLADPQSLLALFRRPMTSIHGYDSEIELDASLNASPLQSEASNIARRIVSALYSMPGSRVVDRRNPSIDVDHIALSLWGQQWPRLRRGFRFCTLSGADRSSDAGAFDLQFTADTDHAVRAKFSGTTEVSRVDEPAAPWVEHAVRDLIAPDCAGLRTFIRSVVADIESGREAFRPLCELQLYLQEVASSPEAIVNAIHLVDAAFGPSGAQAARVLVASQIARQGSSQGEAIDFVLGNRSLLETQSLNAYGKSVGRQIWRRDPRRVVAFLEGSALDRGLAEAIINALGRPDLLATIAAVPELTNFVLTCDPTLLASEEFWDQESLPIKVAFGVLESRRDLISSAAAAILRSSRSDVMDRSIEACGARVLLKEIASLWGERAGVERYRIWIRSVARDASAVASFLSEARDIPATMLLALSEAMRPDDVPNEYGADPWLVAFEGRSTAGVSSASPGYLESFLLARALGSRSRNQAELCRASFASVYAAAAADVLSDPAWHLLEGRVPRVRPWLAWDRCLRLRQGVVDIFVERNLSSLIFAQLSDEPDVFAQLVQVASRSSRGRRYLEHVRHDIAHGDVIYAKEKRGLIDQIAADRW